MSRQRTGNLGVVENVPRLDIRRLRRCHLIRDGERQKATLRWNQPRGSIQIGWATIAAELTDRTDRHVSIVSAFDGQLAHQRIAILARAAPFGGQRFFFACPISGNACEILAHGVHGFASVRANRILYRSQCEGPLGRMILGRERLTRKLWPDGGKRHAARGCRRAWLLNRHTELDAKIDEALDALM